MRKPPGPWHLATDNALPLVAIPGTDPHEIAWLPALPPAPQPPTPQPQTPLPQTPLLQTSHPPASHPPAPQPSPPQAAAELITMAPIDLASELQSQSRAAPAAASPTSPIATRTTYTSGAPGAYNVTLQFRGVWTTALQDVFIAAAERISDTITADIPDVKVGSIMVDDIRITAELATMDGPGGTLGQAGPTALRPGSLLPATAAMRFDSADAQAFQNQGLFDEIVTHEMLHAIGFGTIWDAMGLLTPAGFIGPQAMAEYAKLTDAYAASTGGRTLPGGTPLPPGPVPVETEGNPGTIRAHWSEAIFDTELMTGWLDLPRAISAMVPDPLSALTIASLADLGYTVAAQPPVDLYTIG